MQSDFLKVAIEASKKAEEILLKYFSQELDFSLKEDETPVTKADKESNRIIIETIKSKFPDHGFLTEEEGDDTNSSGFIWIVDPLDGTKNFIREIPNFSIEIALMKDGELITGVSNAPKLGELIYSEKGHGAFLNGEKLQVSDIENLEDAYITFGGVDSLSQGKTVRVLEELAGKVRIIRGFGDCWNYHLLSQGKVEAVIEDSLKIWDIAPMVLAISEAGGVVTDFKGEKVNLQTTDVLTGNKYIHPKLLSLLK